MAKSNLGKEGELFAAKHLEKIGYFVIGKNLVLPGLGELDIVARAPDGVLVFIEVKTVRSSTLVPEDNLTPQKLEKMKRSISAFLSRNPSFREEERIQIDLLAIEAGKGKNPSLRHYRNVF